MTETQRCDFCRRDKPKSGVTCGPTENGPCPCCGLQVVALASDVKKQDNEEETTEQE